MNNQLEKRLTYSNRTGVKIYKKDYSPSFWYLFTIGYTLDIIGWAIGINIQSIQTSHLHQLVIFCALIWMICFITMTNDAFGAIGKSRGWLVGSLCIIPFAFWLPFLIVRHYLRPRGLWIASN